MTNQPPTSPAEKGENCKCACHENKLNKLYGHDRECCKTMNGYVEKDKSEKWEIGLDNLNFFQATKNGGIIIDFKVLKGFIASQIAQARKDGEQKGRADYKREVIKKIQILTNKNIINRNVQNFISELLVELESYKDKE